MEVATRLCEKASVNLPESEFETKAWIASHVVYNLVL